MVVNGDGPSEWEVRLSTGADDRLVFRRGGGRSVEIADIVVRSDRRRGTGRRLVADMLEFVLQWKEPPSMVYAITRQSNTIAHQFYESLKFRILGRLHYFYRDNTEGGLQDCESALVYGRDL